MSILELALWITEQGISQRLSLLPSPAQVEGITIIGETE